MMRVRGYRKASWLVASLGGCLALALALSGSRTATPVSGQPQPSVPPAGRIAIPGGRVLQPGESVTFVPPPFPTPVPGGPLMPRAGGFAPLNTLVRNDSDTRLTVLDDGQSFTVIGYGDEQIQLLMTSMSPNTIDGRPQPGARPFSCGADDEHGNAIRCGAVNASMGGGTVQVAVSTVPYGTTTQSVMLPARASVALVSPLPAGQSTITPGLTVNNISQQDATVTWDGATLTVAAADGFMVNATVRAQSLYTIPLADPGCDAIDGQPSITACDLTGLPPVDVNIDIVEIVASGG